MNQEDLMATAKFKPPTLDRYRIDRNQVKPKSEIQMRILPNKLLNGTPKVGGNKVGPKQPGGTS